MSTLPTTGTIDLLVIQPTPFCNLDCDYCYLPFRQSKQQISRKILDQIFRRVFEASALGDRFTIVWHAGEPLVLPISFYREAMEIIARNNSRAVVVDHSFQTNGTLITSEWCEFIREHQLRIGVSVDGPEFLHDRHRKTRSGRGTWSKVMRGIAALNEHRIPFHVITVLTADSLDYSDEMFAFYQEHGIRQIGFNVEEIEGVNRSSSLVGDAVRERFSEFMRRFYDLVEQSPEPVMVREFQSATSAIMSGGLTEEAQMQQTTPFAIISVDCLGNFSTFSPELLGLTSAEYRRFHFRQCDDGFVRLDSDKAEVQGRRARYRRGGTPMLRYV